MDNDEEIVTNISTRKRRHCIVAEFFCHTTMKNQRNPCVIYVSLVLFLIVIVGQIWWFEFTGVSTAALRKLSRAVNSKHLDMSYDVEFSLMKRNIMSLANDLEKQRQEIKILKQEVDAVTAGEFRDAIRFFPLKDPEVAGPETDRTRFMSTVREPVQKGLAQHSVYPSEASGGRILCIKGRDRSNGSGNSYGFSHPKYIPRNASLFKGLTFISDQPYDYANPWHSLTTLALSIWHSLNNSCEKPERLVLYHNGELVDVMGSWITVILESYFNRRFVPEKLLETDQGPVCFERAVVYRRGFGDLSRDKRIELFETIRCKVRKYCNVFEGVRDLQSVVNVTLVARTGARSFKNESGVAAIIRNQCERVKGCRFRLAHIANLSFCEQVKVMSETDVFATAHGAQLTNMMFMSRGSGIMEMYPKGWLEGAGIGQYIYQWFASWTSMVHEGVYRDTEGPDCPNPEEGRLPCFNFHKDGQVGHNETFLANWTSNVISNFLNRTTGREIVSVAFSSCPCEL